jgi:hypothetical protein
VIVIMVQAAIRIMSGQIMFFLTTTRFRVKLAELYQCQGSTCSGSVRQMARYGAAVAATRIVPDEGDVHYLVGFHYRVSRCAI